MTELDAEDAKLVVLARGAMGRAAAANGAAALGLAGETGQIAPGFSADLALFSITDIRELPYWYGARLCVGSWKAGAPCHPYESVTKLNPRPPEVVPAG